MRHESCWTSYPYQTALSWGVTFIIAVLVALAANCTATPAHASLYIDVAGGYTAAILTTPDGDYLQKGLPHSLDLSSMAYKIELGWRFNERWSVQGGYINLGTVKQSAVFVSDENYSPKTGQCLNGCPNQSNYRMTDAYHGGEITITRTFHPTTDWGIGIKAGGALLMHRFTLHQENGSHTWLQHYGRFPATVAGLSLSYKWAYVETDYYHGLGGSNGFMGQSQGWPLSKEMIVTWFGFKIPLGGA